MFGVVSVDSGGVEPVSPAIGYEDFFVGFYVASGSHYNVICCCFMVID